MKSAIPVDQDYTQSAATLAADQAKEEAMLVGFAVGSVPLMANVVEAVRSLGPLETRLAGTVQSQSRR